MIKGAITVAAFSLIIPLVWDPVAIFMENSAMYIMGVDGQHAGDIAKRVILKAGAVEYRGFDPVAMLNELVWHPGGLIGGVTDTVTGQLQEVFLNTILALARAQAVVLTVLLLFITSIVRVEVTMLAVMMYPITGALALLPIFTNYGLHNVVRTHIIGGLMAPITGAIIFAGGYATILAQEAAGVFPLEQWITSLTILIIASTVPIATMTWISQAAQQANATIGEGFRSTMSIAMPMFSALGGAVMGGGGAGGIGGGAKGFLGNMFGSAAGSAATGGGGGGGGTTKTTSATTAQGLGGTTIPNMPVGGTAPMQSPGGDSNLDKSTAAINTGKTNPMDVTERIAMANEATERRKHKAMAEAIAAEMGGSGTGETGGGDGGDSGSDSDDNSDGETGKKSGDGPSHTKMSLLGAGMLAGFANAMNGSLFNPQQSPLGGGMGEVSKEVTKDMTKTQKQYEKAYDKETKRASADAAATQAKIDAEAAAAQAQADALTGRQSHVSTMGSDTSSGQSVLNLRSSTPTDGAPFGGGSDGGMGGSGDGRNSSPGTAEKSSNNTARSSKNDM